MLHTNRNYIPFKLLHNKPPALRVTEWNGSVWRYIAYQRAGSPFMQFIFPSIESPENSGQYDIMILGRDYDGTVVAMVIEGPDIGRTFIIEFPRDAEGKPIPCTRH